MQKAGCRWVGPGTSFLSPAILRCASTILIPAVQTVNSTAQDSQLLSQAHVCTVETQNCIQDPEGAVPMVFKWSRAIELQTSLSEGGRVREEG